MNRNNYGYYFREGFTPRPQQEEALAWFDENMWTGHRVKVLEGPVATGKSLVADAIAKREEQRGNKTSIVTATNLLLDQYIRDFPEYPCLKGMSHYDCVCFPGNTCETTRLMGAMMGNRHLCGSQCPYVRARSDCYEMPYAIFNTMSYFYFPKVEKVKSTGEKTLITDVLIVDEFQALAPMLQAMFELVLWEEDIKIPHGVSASAVAVVDLLTKRLNAIKRMIQHSAGTLSPKQIKPLVNQAAKIDLIINNFEKKPEEFVVEELEQYRYRKKMRSLRIRTIRPDRKVLNAFFQAKRIVLMSATALDIDVKELGFKNYDKLNLSSPIPKERRKVYVESIVQNSFAKQEIAVPLIAKRIKEIVNARPTERGVVLVTYRQAEMLKEYLTEPHYVFHGKEDRQTVIADFIKNVHIRQVAVLAASFEGLDLKNDIARFVIMGIFPLPNYMDAVVRKRIDMDQNSNDPQHWYEMQAMKQIIQGAGRASRNEKDYSTIHILDTKFVRAYAATKKQLPDVFKEQLIWGRG